MTLKTLDHLDGGEIKAYLATDTTSLALRKYPAKSRPARWYLTVAIRETGGFCCYRRLGMDPGTSEKDGTYVLFERRKLMTLKDSKHSELELDNRETFDMLEAADDICIVPTGRLKFLNGELTEATVAEYRERLGEWVKRAWKASGFSDLSRQMLERQSAARQQRVKKG